LIVFTLINSASLEVV